MNENEWKLVSGEYRSTRLAVTRVGQDDSTRSGTHGVSLECFHGPVGTESTHVNTLVSWTRRKTGVTLPVHVQRRSWNQQNTPQINERMSELMNEWMNKWVNKWMNEQTNEWNTPWMIEWENE